LGAGLTLRIPSYAAWLLALCLPAALAAAPAGVATGSGAEDLHRSEAGRFQLAVEPRLEPLAINVMHGWLLTLRDASGAPVEGAAISVVGGMPEHDHGLPTAPEVTRELGEGRYLLEGVKFHMNGRWELVFSIAAADVRDRVIVDVEL
jgi:hypothetical protein